MSIRDPKCLGLVKTARFGQPFSRIPSDGTVSKDSNKKCIVVPAGLSNSDSYCPDTVQVLSLRWLALKTTAARHPSGTGFG